MLDNLRLLGCVLLLAMAVSIQGIAVAVPNPTSGKVVCYFGSWAEYRTDNASLKIENIPGDLCTHVVYAFIGMSSNGDVANLDLNIDLPSSAAFPGRKDGLRRMVALKQTYPNLKVMVALGGGSFGSAVFSQVAANSAARVTAATSLLKFVRENGFDGLDVDWEFPTEGTGSSPADKANFVLLLQELKSRFSANGLLLSAAVSASRFTMDTSYDFLAVQSHLDFINLMAYDYHQYIANVDTQVNHNAPLRGSVDSVESSVTYWLSKGVPASKLVLGVPIYGKSYTLASAAQTQVGAQATGPGAPGIYTNTAGILDYIEVCTMRKTMNWTVEEDTVSMATYMYSGRDWVSFESSNTAKEKARYANTMKLGGVMVWSLASDDVKGACGPVTFPILRALHDAFLLCV